MARYSIEDTTLTTIANAIRAKTGKYDPIPVSDMANQISAITTGGSANNSTATIYSVESANNTNSVLYMSPEGEIKRSNLSTAEPIHIRKPSFFMITGDAIVNDSNPQNRTGVYCLKTPFVKLSEINDTDVYDANTKLVLDDYGRQINMAGSTDAIVVFVNKDFSSQITFSYIAADDEPM